MRIFKKAVILLLLTFISCSKGEEGNFVDRELSVISLKINGVWVNSKNRNDSVLLHFEKYPEKNKEYLGLMTRHFILKEGRFKVTQLHEPTMRLFKEGNKAIIKVIPFFGEQKLITMISDSVLIFDEGDEFVKIKSIK